MNNSKSERRLTENEAIFREQNERVQKGLDELEALARETGQMEHVSAPDGKLSFYCECADENCTKRVHLTLQEYRKVHQNRKCFSIVPGHENLSIERVVERESRYYVVQKAQTPPESPEDLNPTNGSNV